MHKFILGIFTLLTLLSLYSSYTGLGVEGFTQEEKKTIHHSNRYSSSHGYGYSGGSSSGWGYGK